LGGNIHSLDISALRAYIRFQKDLANPTPQRDTTMNMHFGPGMPPVFCGQVIPGIF